MVVITVLSKYIGGSVLQRHRMGLCIYIEKFKCPTVKMGTLVPESLLVSSRCIYTGYHTEAEARRSKRLCCASENQSMSALRGFLSSQTSADVNGPRIDGFGRMAKCRTALECMDRRGWDRSYFQRKFHESFMQATARSFWKNDGDGQFARDHQAILQMNGWDDLAQEVLISTPRRFGKTISVSMFAAALMFSAASVELSIYSTCKRISQKLLRNVRKFINIVFEDLGMQPFKVIRENQEEVVLQGPEGIHDVRVVNSYPSRVSHFFFLGVAPLCRFATTSVTRVCKGLSILFISTHVGSLRSLQSAWLCPKYECMNTKTRPVLSRRSTRMNSGYVDPILSCMSRAMNGGVWNNFHFMGSLHGPQFSNMRAMTLLHTIRLDFVSTSSCISSVTGICFLHC